MKKEKYITDAEYRKCKKIASVFSILEEDDIVLLDVGRYGFVALFYYTPPRGFDTVQSFTDSQEVFDCLWDDKIFKKLPAQKQAELLSQQDVFLEMAGLKKI